MEYFTYNSDIKKFEPTTIVPASDVFPKGMITPFAGSTAPTGWLICDGSTFSATAYPQLAAVLGNTYGAAVGDNYYLPDLRGRAPIGAGTGTGLTARALATTVGAEAVTLTSAQSGVPAHSHANTLSSNVAAASGHTHGPGSFHAAIGATNSDPSRIGYVAGYNSGGPGTATYSIIASGLLINSAPFNHYTPVYGGSGGPSADTTVGITNVNNTAANAASSHENMQPSIALNYIIKA
jgi:microcystin-dependent protein